MVDHGARDEPAHHQPSGGGARAETRRDTGEHADEPTEARSTLTLLVDRRFGPFFAGKLLFGLGSWMHNVAAAILVWELTRSAILVGAVSVGQFLPQMLLAPWSGARADRGDRQRQLAVARLISMLGSGGLALWIFVLGVEGTSGAAVVIVAAVIVGVGFAVGLPPMQALLPALVRPSELSSAVALNSLTMTIGRTVGPALGAFVLTFGSPALAFALAALTHLAFAVTISLIRLRDVARSADASRSIFAGLRAVRSDKVLLALLIGVSCVGIGAEPAITLTPPLADLLGQDSSFVGVLASAFGVGATFGFLTLRRLQVRVQLGQLAVTGLLMLGGGMGALAFSFAAPYAIAMIGVAGVGMAYALSSLTTMVHQRVDEDVRGRVMALWGVAFLGTRPLSAALSGAIADLFNVQLALFAIMAIVAFGAWSVRPTRIGRPGTD